MKKKLQLELAAVIDCGERFVKATYLLKGDGPLAFICCDTLSALDQSIVVDYYPNLKA